MKAFGPCKVGSLQILAVAAALFSFHCSRGNDQGNWRRISPTISGRISGGSGHTCVIMPNHTVSCWGDNEYSQLGDGTTTSSQLPVKVQDVSSANKIDCEKRGCCALQAQGSVKCWGYKSTYLVSEGWTASISPGATTVPGINNAVDIAVGDILGCAIVLGGSVKCWGNNFMGRLGNGSTVEKSDVPVEVSGISHAVSITASAFHICALLDSGSIMCWGQNNSGQLGNGESGPRTGDPSLHSSIPVTVSGIDNAVAVSAGELFTCASLASGEVKCWGSNGGYQIGNACPTYHCDLPVTIPDIDSAVVLATGLYHTCGLLRNGSVKCWGVNDNGQLGAGLYVSPSSPVAVRDLAGALGIGGGYEHTCAMTAGGAIKCWGNDFIGQLGDQNVVWATAPTPAIGISGPVSLTSDWIHSCALFADGAIKCWGANFFGQLGSGERTYVAGMVSVPGISGAIAVDAGETHNCALMNDGTASCWGNNFLGQIGDGTTVDFAFSPRPVAGISGTEKLASGGTSSCALLAGGSVACWGSNAFGELGAGSTVYSSNLPMPVVGINNAVDIAVGSGFACAVLEGGPIKCWGANGCDMLGGATGGYSSNVPVEVIGISSALSVTAGNGRICAVLEGGSVACWGCNNEGELGKGSRIVSRGPVLLTGISDPQQLALGSGHSCALMADQTVQCWGYNWCGQLGRGSFDPDVHGDPLPVSGISDAVAISAGESYTCAILAGGSVECWGNNEDGQLGIGSSGYSPVPVLVSGL